jgi:spermidine/putrescine transport system permease protein
VGARIERGVVYPLGFWQSLAAPGIAWLLVFFILPFFVVLAIALGTTDPLFLTPLPVWNPLEWNADNFRFVGEQLTSGDAAFRVVLIRTCIYVGAAMIACLLVGYPTAYYLARHAGRTRNLLLALILAPFWISYIMRMLGWVNLLQTDGYLNRVLTLLQVTPEPVAWLEGRPATVILGLVYGYVPFLILPLYAALDRIDPAMLEAARDLGASPARTFIRVTMPLAKHGVLAGVVLIMLPMFGDYYTPDLLSGRPRTTMLGNEIAFYVQGTPNGAGRGAALVMVLAAMLTVFMAYYLVVSARAAREIRL